MPTLKNCNAQNEPRDASADIVKTPIVENHLVRFQHKKNTATTLVNQSRGEKQTLGVGVNKSGKLLGGKFPPHSLKKGTGLVVNANGLTAVTAQNIGELARAILA